MRPLVLTPGEPAGIGPDLVIQLAQSNRNADWLVIADPDLLMQRADILGLKLNISTSANLTRKACELSVLPVHLSASVTAGVLDVRNAAYVLATLDLAVEGCLNGDYSALVTGPVQKSVINDAGVDFTGHTDYLARACNCDNVVMMLATGDLRVALATVHIPLARVSVSLTIPGLSSTLGIVHAAMRDQFGINNPRILVCGLNPHAGEQGHLGREEIEVIQPVIETLSKQGMSVTGPYPADTVFTPNMLAQGDVVVAMYHDQGLPVLKYKGFGSAVNITLGLPLIRTSVDHGTALDIAGSGSASSASLIQALNIASSLVAHGSQSAA
jgi:4-hydroxythreonine-4-phosphate dehydrogenase